MPLVGRDCGLYVSMLGWYTHTGEAKCLEEDVYLITCNTCQNLSFKCVVIIFMYSVCMYTLCRGCAFRILIHFVP